MQLDVTDFLLSIVDQDHKDVILVHNLVRIYLLRLDTGGNFYSLILVSQRVQKKTTVDTREEQLLKTISEQNYFERENPIK